MRTKGEWVVRPVKERTLTRGWRGDLGKKKKGNYEKGGWVQLSDEGGPGGETRGVRLNLGGRGHWSLWEPEIQIWNLEEQGRERRDRRARSWERGGPNALCSLLPLINTKDASKDTLLFVFINTMICLHSKESTLLNFWAPWNLTLLWIITPITK